MNTTASGLSRFKKCTASSILPQIRSTSEAAERGTWIHKFLDKATYIEKEAALRDIPEEFHQTCLGIDVHQILADVAEPETEVAYALDPRTRSARRLGRSMGREYGALEAEIAGAEDVIGKRRMDGKPICMDYKTGDWVGPVKTNAQIGFFVACLMLLTGAQEVEGRIVYIREDGSHEIESANFGPFDVDDYLDALKGACIAYDNALLKYNQNGDISVTVGDHCAYCPSVPFCPAYTALAKRMTSELAPIDQKIGIDADLDDPLTIEQKIASLSLADAAKAWVLKKRIADLFYRVDDGLKMYAKSLPILLENGKTVAPVSFKKKFFSEETALKLLKEMGATSDQISTCYRSKTITQVRELKPQKK